MTRVKRGFKARRRRKKILKLASGYYGGRHRLFRTAKETVERALVFAYRDRRVKKRNFRKLWITRINAASRLKGLKYSVFMDKLNKTNIKLNRKILAELAVSDFAGFEALVKAIS